MGLVGSVCGGCILFSHPSVHPFIRPLLFGFWAGVANKHCLLTFLIFSPWKYMTLGLLVCLRLFYNQITLQSTNVWYSYLYRKLVNYDLFMFFKTENLHFKHFLYGRCHFVLPNEPKCQKMYPTRKDKNKKQSAHHYFFFFFLKKWIFSLTWYIDNCLELYIAQNNIFAFLNSVMYLSTINTYFACDIFSRWQTNAIFFLFFLENRIWLFMQIVSSGDNLHEMSDPIF